MTGNGQILRGLYVGCKPGIRRPQDKVGGEANGLDWVGVVVWLSHGQQQTERMVDLLNGKGKASGNPERTVERAPRRELFLGTMGRETPSQLSRAYEGGQHVDLDMKSRGQSWRLVSAARNFN